MPKRAGSVGKQNVEAGQKERGAWPKNAFCGQNVKNAGQKKIYHVPVHGGARGWGPGGRYHNYIEYDKRSNNDITIKRMCVWGGTDRGGGVYGAVLALASGGAPPHLPPRASARACVRRCVCAGGAYRGWRHRANNPHERRFLLPISSCLLNCLEQIKNRGASLTVNLRTLRRTLRWSAGSICEFGLQFARLRRRCLALCFGAMRTPCRIASICETFRNFETSFSGA